MLKVDLHHFDAFAFDLDGVVTKTASVHASSWKRAFDELLEQLADGRAWQPFDIERDYQSYVDGKPRRDGIRSFLDSRGIALPVGTTEKLAARKQAYVLDHLARKGVEVYADALILLRRARANGVAIAVVTASENCASVLEAACLVDLFDVRVDGLDIARLGLRGKPAPDTFLEASRRLATPPLRCVVFEDSEPGVRAGRAGHFGLVVGVDRVGHAEALREQGADVVVSMLDEIDLVHAAREQVPR